MRPVILFVSLLFCLEVSWSQSGRLPFFYSNARLEKVLSDVESKFSIRYSYVDSLVVNQTVSIPKKKYSIDEINQCIADSTGLQITDIDGRFFAISKNEATESVKKYYLDEIQVEGFLTKGINKTNQKFTIYPQKIEALPGVTDADILLSLQQLPGVKSPNETASGLHVRGGTPDQNLVLWDGIRLYHPGHLFGMISGINPNVAQTVHFYNKATNPKFGQRISSIIDIKTTDKISDNAKVNVGLNAINADAYVQLPVLKNKLGLQLSGRKSYTEWLQTTTFNQLADKVFQNTNFNDFDDRNQFGFEDYSAKVNYTPNSKTAVSATGIFIDNQLDFTTSPTNGSENTQQLGIQNYGFSLNWSQKYGSKLSQKAVFYYSLYDFAYEKRLQYNPSQFEAFKKRNRIIDSGGEINFSYAFHDKLHVDFGYQLFGNDVSHLFNSYNQDIGIDLSIKHLYSVSNIGYGYLRYDWRKWNFNAGVRYNHYGSRVPAQFEPRLLIGRRFSEALTWHSSYERKSQIISQVRESNANDQSLENYVWVLAENKDYPIQRANQFTTGFTLKNKQWLLDVDAYYKTIDGITTLSFGFLNTNDANNPKGKGFTKGFDLLLQQTAQTWRSWLTYTYQDSQNKFENVNGSDYFALNTNIRHALNLAFNKKWDALSLAVGWFWHSGKPYSTLDSSGQVASFNADRLPAYHRLDVSATYQLYRHKDNAFKIGVSIYNVYNNHVIISREFERSYINLEDYNTPRYVARDYYSLGITPNVFLRMAF